MNIENEPFKNLADNLPSIVWIAAPDGFIEYYNRNWYEYTGQTRGAAKGWGWKNAYHPKDLNRVLAEWSKALEMGLPYEAEFRLKSVKSGKYRWFLTRVVPVRDASGRIIKWFGTNTDIHNIKAERRLLNKTQSELNRAKLIAEAANDAKSEFVANMSHEIRTPLAAISGYSSFLLESNRIPPQQKDYAKAIVRNSKHLANLIDEILDLSKIEAGHLEIEPLTFNLGEILEYVEAVLGFKASNKGIGLKIERDENVPKNINTDPTRLRQILLNMIGNAVKFTEKGKVEVRIDCPNCHDESDNREPQILRITIHDTGLGITEAEQQNLFTRFMQSDRSVTRKYGGTGLGLALSKKLARALGGDISLIKSERGEGSVFQVTIKIGQPSEFSQSDLRDPITERTDNMLKIKRRPFKDLRILIVDDSPDNREIIETMLQPTGAIIETASDGAEGVEQALHSEFDVILMDIQMPVLDGHEATKKLRRAGFKKPIIALTAHAMKEERERAFTSGFDDHLAKPVTQASLISTIAHYAAKIRKDIVQRNTVSH